LIIENEEQLLGKVILSLPPSFAPQNPPPSSEGGILSATERSSALGTAERKALEINLSIGRLPLTRELSAVRLTEGEKVRFGLK